MSNSYALTVTFDGPNPTLVQENGQRLPTELVEIPDIPSGGLGPLARLKWIDGNTAIPSGEQTGTEGAPYGSPALWLATLLAPASADDANTIQEGVIAPTATDVWSPNPQTWTIPAARNILLRSLQDTGPTVAQGASFASPVITWANTAATFTPGISVLAFTDVAMTGTAAFTITDAAGASQSRLIFQGRSCNVVGTLNVSGSTFFNAIQVFNSVVNLTVTNPGGGPTWGLTVLAGGTWTSAGLSCTTVTANDSTVADTGSNLTTTGAQAYAYCTITANGLKTTGASVISFVGCTFTRATVITATTSGASVTFDGDSYASFIANGGTFASGTIVTVQGGYLAGEVAGANVASPAGNAATLSINGTGATATWASGGNSYLVTTLAGNTTLTVSDAGGAVAGTTMLFTRTDTSGYTLTISDATAGAIATLPPGGGGFVLIAFNGTAWVLKMI